MLALLVPPRGPPRAQAQLRRACCAPACLSARDSIRSSSQLSSLPRAVQPVGLLRDLQGRELSAGRQAGSCQRRCSVRIICSLNDQLLEGRDRSVLFSAIYIRAGPTRGKHSLEMRTNERMGGSAQRICSLKGTPVLRTCVFSFSNRKSPNMSV